MESTAMALLAAVAGGMGFYFLVLEDSQRTAIKEFIGLKVNTERVADKDKGGWRGPGYYTVTTKGEPFTRVIMTEKGMDKYATATYKRPLEAGFGEPMY